MNIKITKAQLEAIKLLADDCSAMLGVGNEITDKSWNHAIKLIDRMLNNNNLKPRDYN